MNFKNRKLKNVLINPRYQLRYVFWLSATALFLITVNAAVFYHYISENYSVLVELSPMTEEAKGLLYSELRRILFLLGGASLVFVVLTSILGIFYSHRTAGPLYHFNRVFKLIASGKTDSRVVLRPNDDFREVAQSFNEMMDKIVDKGR